MDTSRRAGGKPAEVLELAQTTAHYAGTPRARADKECIVWSAKKLLEFGCITADGMEKLRKGGSPMIMNGEHAGDSIALDHVLPRSLVPELAARFYNLEAIPSRQNLAKSDRIGKRELELARRWQKMGLLSAKGLNAIAKSSP